MGITLGESTKLLDNIMTNYSQWHIERAPTGKKVNPVEEIAMFSDKMDALMNMFTSKNAHVNPNGVPLYTLIEQNNDAIDVNFVARNNFGRRKILGNKSILTFIPIINTISWQG